MGPDLNGAKAFGGDRPTVGEKKAFGGDRPTVEKIRLKRKLSPIGN